MQRLVLVFVVVLVLSGCGSNAVAVVPTPIAQIVPSATKVQPTQHVPDASSTNAFKSGGLGLSRVVWEKAHGRPGPDIPSWESYENKAFSIYWYDDTAKQIEQYWLNAGVSITAAESAAEQLIPSDSKFVKTYTSVVGRRVDLYTSDSLKTRFPESIDVDDMNISLWVGGEVGEFIVIYRAQPSGRIESIVLAIGNGP